MVAALVPGEVTSTVAAVVPGEATSTVAALVLGEATSTVEAVVPGEATSTVAALVPGEATSRVAALVPRLNRTWQVKGRDIDLCTKVPNDVQAETYLSIGGHNKKLKSASNSSNVEVSSMSNDLCQTTILEMCRKNDKSVVDKLLTHMLY
ncbi:hypothetical protein FCV25MIE_12625 [Fagus crenata]